MGRFWKYPEKYLKGNVGFGCCKALGKNRKESDNDYRDMSLESSKDNN